MELINIKVKFIMFELVYTINFNLIRQFFFLDQICPKRVLPAQKRKFEYHYRILKILINLSTAFHLKEAILVFQIRFCQEMYFQSIKCITTKCNMLELIWTLNFILNKQFWFFGPNFCSRIEKKKHHDQIENIWITVYAKFHLKRIIFII